MNQDVFRRLAQRLDTIPNGFPPTETGVELRLLQKLFSPEEAGLASLMSPEPETIAEIAGRGGLDPDQARLILKGMASRGLIGFQRREGQLAFSLVPFIVGFYEAQLPRMDAELALLFEQYYQDGHASLLRSQPSVHRVIPVGEAIPVGIEIFPYERASELIESAKAWGVRDCICRVQQHLVGKGCDRPIEACLTFAPVDGVFVNSTIDRAITKEEALRILREAEEAGLVHSTSNYRSGIDYICNCCTCCCGILRGITEFGIPTAAARSDFHTVVESRLCTGCGDCVERCMFHALAVPDLLAIVDASRCVGCGLCASSCSTEALHLERRPASETVHPPADIEEWRAERMARRAAGLPLGGA
jgi:ferredoxin